MTKYHITLKRVYVNLIYSLFSTFFIVIFTVSAIFLDEAEDKIIMDLPSIIATIIFGLIAAAVSMVFAYILNRKQLFYCENDGFVKESGWLFKRRVYVPFKNINTISVKRSLFDIILKISKIEIDTGTTASTKPEFSLYLCKNYASSLKNFLENKKANDELIFPVPGDNHEIIIEQENYFIKAKWTQLLKMSILKEGLLASLITINLCAFFIYIILITFGHLDSEINVNVVKEVFFPWVFMIMNVAIIGFTMLFTVLYYFNYRVIIKDDYLEYRYGLISQTIFRLKRDRINSINVRQSLLYQLTNNYEVELSVLGIGDISPENSEKNSIESKLVILISKFDKVQELFYLLGVNMLEDQTYVKPKRYSKTIFLTIPIIILTILGLVIILSTYKYIEKNYLIYLPLIISYGIIIFGLILRKKNHGYYFNNTQIKVRHGMYRKSITYTQFKRIQAIEYRQGIIKLILGIGNVVIAYKDSGGVMRLLNETNNVAFALGDKIINKH